MGYSARGEELMLHVPLDTGAKSSVFWDATETFIIHEEYCELPQSKGLGDAAWLSAALSRAIHEQHPWHYYPVTEERLAIWKRVMDRIIKHKPQLAAVVGPWYTGIEVSEAEDAVPQPATKAEAKSKKPTAAGSLAESETTKAAAAKKARTRRAKPAD